MLGSCIVATIILVILNVAGVISWPLLAIFAPILGYFVLWIIFFGGISIIIGGICVIAGIISKVFDK